VIRRGGTRERSKGRLLEGLMRVEAFGMVVGTHKYVRRPKLGRRRVFPGLIYTSVKYSTKPKHSQRSQKWTSPLILISEVPLKLEIMSRVDQLSVKCSTHLAAGVFPLNFWYIFINSIAETLFTFGQSKNSGVRQSVPPNPLDS